MIQEVSTALFEAVSQRLEADGPISRRGVEDANIPDPLRDYLIGILEREAERIASTINEQRDEWVAESVDVRRARTAFAVAASRNVQIPADRTETVLRSACDSVVRYLIQPARALQAAVFEGRASDRVEVEDILDGIRPFAAYPYFQDVLQHYFNEKEIEDIDRARLEGIFQRIDRQMTSDFEPADWADLLDPLFETLAAADPYKEGVPAEMLRLFFRDKEAGELLIRLEDFEDDDLIARSELSAVLEAPPVVVEEEPEVELEEIQEVEEVEDVQPERAAAPQQRPPDVAARQQSPQKEAEKPSEGAGPVPLWKQFQQKPAQQQAPPKAPPQRQPPPQRPAPQPSKASPPSGPSKPIWQQFRPDPAAGTIPADVSQKSSNLENLERNVLGQRAAASRRMFVRQIFGGSEDKYREALDRLSVARSWAEASKIIAKEIFRPNDVNIYDDAAVSFTNLVEDRFSEQQRS